MNDFTQAEAKTLKALDSVFDKLTPPIVKSGPTPADMLSFLDAMKSYIEIGGREVGSAFISYEGAGWKAFVCKKTGIYSDIEGDDDYRHSTLRQALEAVMDWRATLQK